MPALPPPHDRPSTAAAILALIGLLIILGTAAWAWGAR